jgi:uncharacterized protein DUF3995
LRQCSARPAVDQARPEVTGGDARGQLSGAGQSPDDVRTGTSGRAGAIAAAVVGLAYAAISIYWGAGGTWLLSTVGAALATGRSAAALAAVWAAVVLKVVAAVVPLVACQTPTAGRWRRWLRILAWAEGTILTLYGLVLSVAGVLVQAGVVAAGKAADHRALTWHAYLWDPWFLVWGLLVVAALLLSRPRQQPSAELPLWPEGRKPVS